MHIILLSGGSGKRLWPLSNEVRSKQFLKIFKLPDGSHESMLQRMYRMIHEVDPKASITIATSENQVTSIRSQLGDSVGISIEPCRRDTFPAIALATSYLHDVQGVDENEVVIVCPVDPYVEKPFFEMLGTLHEQSKKGCVNLTLIGIEPTYPSEKYGYIIPETSDAVSTVSTFKEKPDATTAEKYIRQGALWNAGVFAYKLSYVLDIAKTLLGTSSYQEIFDNYENLNKISFDYAVVEKVQKINVMRFSGAWKDLGTWNTLTEAMSDEVAGNAVAADCENTHVINELQIPLIALGTKNLAIAATPDGILVVDKASSDKLKEYVGDQRPMYEKRVWGEYQVLDYRIQADGQNFLTKHLIITPGQHISYQIHRHRTEMWTFVDGKGKLILDGEVKEVGRGDTAYIKPGMKHAIKADTELHIIEVQVGDELTEEDIERLEWDWEQDGL
ncbi:MAG: cupin domain-containing protein [Lachnospiraceae bacterium]|nr:cupin domain-containing protein [Lachnospiraceae bacterium]